MTTVNPMQFIATVGVAGFVSGVQTGMVGQDQAQAGFEAIGQAIDGYVEAQPRMTPLTEIRKSIDSLPHKSTPENVIRMIEDRSSDVEKVVRFAMMAQEIGAAVAAGLEAPFDLGDEWRWIPAGEFRMQDPCKLDKKILTVMTDGFFMLDHPVTNAEFRAFIDAIGHEDSRLRDLYPRLTGDLQPAVKVNFEEAAAYSLWLGERISGSKHVPVIGRLPTEDEWTKTAYGYGFEDMIGNVWEWTSTPWQVGLSQFILRGGSRDNYGRRGFHGGFNRPPRSDAHPGNRDSVIGFRPMLEPVMIEREW